MLCSVSEMLDFDLCKVSIKYIYYMSKSFLTPCGQITEYTIPYLGFVFIKLALSIIQFNLQSLLIMSPDLVGKVHNCPLLADCLVSL